MSLSATRTRLLSSVAMGLGMMVFAAQPAEAACNLTATNNPGDTIECTGVTTTANVAGSRQRGYVTAVNPFFIDISAGAFVDGFGLAFTNNAGGPNPLTITNNGTIQVNATNTPTAGGSNAALFVNNNGNPIIYDGSGDIINLGTGEGLRVALNNAGSFTADIGGSIFTNAGNALNVTAFANSGAINITTTAGEAISASGGDGIHVLTAGSGNVNIDSNAAITDGLAGPGTLQNAILVNSTGAGDINIAHHSGGLSDQSQQDYIVATINNVASAGDIDIVLGGGGTLNAAGVGINAQTTGSGNITIDSTDASIVADAEGIEVITQGGSIAVTAGNVTSNGGTNVGITARQEAAAGLGNVTVVTNGAISGGLGILAVNSGLGDVTVTTGGGIVTGTIVTSIFNAASLGNTLVNIGAGGVTAANDSAIISVNVGSGTVTVNSLGAITSTNGIGIDASSTTGAIMIDATGPIAGAMGGISALTQGGSVTVAAGDVTSTSAVALVAQQLAAGGNGDVTVTASGVISSEIGIFANNAGFGDVTVTTGAGLVSGTAGRGVSATISNASSSGDVLVDIGTGGIASVNEGVFASNVGTGDVTVNSLGAITSINGIGINASSTGSGEVMVSAAGAVSGVTGGIDASSTGSGDVTVNSLGAITSTNGIGIDASSTTGAIMIDATGPIAGAMGGISALTQGGSVTVAAGDVTSTSAVALVAQQLAAGGNGDVTVTASGVISSEIGIFANNAGFGDVTVTTGAGLVSGTAGRGVSATISNASSSGDVLVDIGTGGIASVNEGVFASNVGTGDVTVNSLGAITSINGIGINASSTGSGEVMVSAAGAVSGVTGGIDASSTGSGDVTVNSLGAITSTNGIGIDASSTTGAIMIDATGPIAGAMGGISALTQGGSVTVAAGDVTSTSAVALVAQQLAAGGNGDVTVTASGVISSEIGIFANNAGFGDVTVTTGAGLVSGTAGRGVSATISNASSSGDVLVDIGTGGIASVNEGVFASNVGTGDVTVNSLGAITSINGIGINASSTGSGEVMVSAAGPVIGATGGIQALSQGGTVTVTAGDVTSTGGNASAIVARQEAVAGDGDVLAMANGAVSGEVGINALNAGTGDVTVTSGDGLITGTVRSGIIALIDNINSAGDILVDAGAGGVSSNNDSAILAQTLGTGTVTVNSLGAITSTNSLGINASANAGAIMIDATGPVTGSLGGIQAITQGGSITVAAGDVTSTGADAIIANQADVNGDGDVTVTTTGAVSGGTTGITAINNGLGGVTVNAAGPVTGATSFGILALIDNAGSTGDVVVTSGEGGVTAQFGIGAGTIGTGNVTVNSSGAVNSATGDGIFTLAASGATLVNVTGGSVTGAADGIDVGAIDGTIDVVLSGGADVTGTNGIGILLTSAGAKSIDVGVGSVVNGGLDAINAGGGSTLTITNAGTIGPAVGIMITSDLLTATTITNLTGGILNGGVGLSDQADVISNGGTWNVSGGNAFNGGVDIVTNAAGGVINSATGTVFSDLEDLTTLGGSSFNVAGTLDFANVATSLTNGGALVLADGAAVTGLGVIMSNGTIEGGAGSSLSNLGNVTNLAGGVISTSGDFTLTTTGDFANAGMLDLAPALFTLAGATSFTNSGTINAIGGATDLVIPGLLDNSGAINLSNGVVGDVLTLTGDYVGSGNAVLNLDVTSQSATDRLVVVGAVSGTTSLNVNPVGSVITGTDGILVVDADTSTADAFVLGSTGAGLVNYSLLQQGADYYLIGLLNTNAFAPLLLDGVATDLWHQSADVVGTHLALKRQALGAGAGRSGLWGRFYWGRDRSGARHTQNLFGDDLVVDQRVETGRTGAQLGFDYKTGGAVIGFTAGYEHAGAEHVATSTGLKAGGYNLGVYGLLGSDTGFYGSLLAKYDHGQARLTNNALFDGVGKLSLDSWGVDGKAGYRWATGGGRLDVGGGLTWVRSSIEDFTVSGIDYDFATARSLRGQIGVRYEGRDSYGPYVDARLLHEFKDSNDVSLRSGTELDVARAEGRGTWGRLEVGVAPHGKSGPTAAIWAQVGDAHGIGVQAGWKF